MFSHKHSTGIEFHEVLERGEWSKTMVVRTNLNMMPDSDDEEDLNSLFDAIAAFMEVNPSIDRAEIAPQR